MNQSLIEEVSKNIVTGDLPALETVIKSALDSGIDPSVIMNEGLIPGMARVGELFEKKEYFLPEVLYSARAMKGALQILHPLLAKSGFESRGKIVLGTIMGDLHDIGKNIVIMMLEGAGFNVVDLGVDMTVETIIEKIKVIMPDILGLSALLTTTMPEMERAIQELKAKGLREKVKVMVGGAPVNKSFAEKIGADGHGADATEAVKLARRLIGTAK